MYNTSMIKDVTHADAHIHIKSRSTHVLTAEASISVESLASSLDSSANAEDDNVKRQKRAKSVEIRRAV